jgi:hypothetical protein
MRSRGLSTESESKRVQGWGTTVPKAGAARSAAYRSELLSAPQPLGLAEDAAISTVSQRVVQDWCVDRSSRSCTSLGQVSAPKVA